MTALSAHRDPSRAERWMRRLVDVYGPDAREVLEAIIAQLSADELAALNFHWPIWARSKQLLPVDPWRVLLLLCGRGWGKDRAINEYLLGEVAAGNITRALIIARTDNEAERVIVKGNRSGILAIAPPWLKARFFSAEPARVEFLNGAAVAYLASAEKPDSVRGENLDLVIGQEVAAWRPEHAAAVFYNARMALRGKEGARFVLATTGRKRRPLLREIVDKAKTDPDRYRVIVGHTLENRHNPKDFRADMLAEYGGTALEAQELGGGLLDETDEDSLWQPADIRHVARAPKLVRIVVAVDPAISVRKHSDQTGIVAAGLGVDGMVYVLRDESGKLADWPAVVKKLAGDMVKLGGPTCAVSVLAETNRGGMLVAKAIRDEGVTLPIVEVNSQESKEQRADPVARLYKRREYDDADGDRVVVEGRVLHLGGLDELETEQTTWHPAETKSPNRLDALVHAIWLLMGGEDGMRAVREAFEVSAAAGAGLPRPRRAPGELADVDDDDEWSGLRGGGDFGGIPVIG